MNGIRMGHCVGTRAAAYCLGAGFAMLVSTLVVYAQHPYATHHPNVGCPHGHGHLPLNLGCPHGLGHLPGHHAHHCPPQGSTPFPYDSPSYDDYQHLMRDFETRPPDDLRDLQWRIRQITQIEETVTRERLRIQAYQQELQQQIWAQTPWITRGAGRNLSGPNHP